jgi:hypothetical protein
MCIVNALSRTLALPDMQVFKLTKPAAAKSAVQANNKRCIAQTKAKSCYNRWERVRTGQEG